MLATIYTKDNCPFCTKAKMLFKNRNIEYKEYIIVADINSISATDKQFYVTRNDLLAKAPHAKTVPQIWLDDTYIGGYTELAKYLENK